MFEETALQQLVANALPGIIARLSDLRREFETSGDWPEAMQVNASLILSDVCRRLGLSNAERMTVLGLDAAFYVAQQEDCRPVVYDLDEEAGNA